jgi:putative restriction endonuclease
MRFWWVSQNQTYEQEVGGGYLWSPKRNRDESKNHFYETMREVSRGDLVFSFNNRKIMAVGVIVGPAYTSPKPPEFGSAGINWQLVGWRVDVKYHTLVHQIEPRHHMNLLTPLLPQRYSPIRPDGTGNQMYLAEIPSHMALVMIDLIGLEGKETLQEGEWIRETSKEPLLSVTGLDLINQWDMNELGVLEKDEQIPETEKTQIVRSRIGQGTFKNRVAEIESHCRITGVAQRDYLIASHIKPWRMSSNKERLDGSNGLLLTPNADHLFDEGFIAFRDNGAVLVSPVADREALSRMGMPIQSDELNVGNFTSSQKSYLEFHRDSIFLQSAQ